VPEPALSVVVPTRGGVRRLPVLLDSLAAQSLDEPWEVVVVLDGDVDGSRALLESYADRVPLRIVDRTGGTGVGAALAAGYEAARGEIVMRCDDDLTPRPGFLAAHLARHRARPAGSPPLGVVSMTRDVFADTAYAAAYGRPANQRLLAQAYARPADERWQHWAACNSVPRAAYEAVGGFDPTLGYREDSELGLRLAQAGVEIVIDHDLEVEHRAPAPDTATRAARAFSPFTRPELLYAEDFDLYQRIQHFGAIARLDEALVLYRVHPGGVSKRFVDIMEAASVRVLTERYTRLFDERAARVAGLIVQHSMAKRPVPDRAALATLGSALSVIQADFLATHACSAHDIRLIRWETARRWGDIGRSGLRAGTVRLGDVLAVRPDHLGLGYAGFEALLWSGFIGGVRRARRRMEQSRMAQTAG